LATPQWMSQIRAQDRPVARPRMFGFSGESGAHPGREAGAHESGSGMGL